MSHPKINFFMQSFSEEARAQLLAQAETLKPILDEVHSKMPTGKYYYSDYMRIISMLNDKRPNVGVKVWGLLLLIAGANPTGIEAAVKNL